MLSAEATREVMGALKLRYALRLPIEKNWWWWQQDLRKAGLSEGNQERMVALFIRHWGWVNKPTLNAFCRFVRSELSRERAAARRRELGDRLKVGDERVGEHLERIRTRLDNINHDEHDAHDVRHELGERQGTRNGEGKE